MEMVGIVEVAGNQVYEKDNSFGISLEEKNAMSYVDKVCNSQLMAAKYKNMGAVNNIQLQDLAYRDFITPPKILGIYCEKFLSNRNKPIVIRTKDDIGVRQVVVKIFNGKNELVEKGLGKQYLQNEKWFYFVKTEIKGQKEIRIEAKAIDFPGNMAVSSQWILV